MYRSSVKILTLVTAFSLLIIGYAVAGQAGTYSITPSVGYHLMDTNLQLDDAVVFGLGFGYNISPKWSVETDIRYTPAKTDTASSVDVDILMVSLGGLYNFNPNASLNPYLTFGGGFMSYDIDSKDSSDEDAFGYYGVGLKYSLSKSTDLRLDARHLLDYRSDNKGDIQGDDTWSNHFQATLGFTYYFNLFQ